MSDLCMKQTVSLSVANAALDWPQGQEVGAAAADDVISDLLYVPGRKVREKTPGTPV